ncbi:MAG: hypothetical protein ACLVAW_24495 [Eisenbergiella massiliensis]
MCRYETDSYMEIIIKIMPPVMLALLIQSVYNIVDSYFVAQYPLTG